MTGNPLLPIRGERPIAIIGSVGRDLKCMVPAILPKAPAALALRADDLLEFQDGPVCGVEQPGILALRRAAKAGVNRISIVELDDLGPYRVTEDIPFTVA